MMSVENNTIEIYRVGTSVTLTENINAKIITIAIHDNDTVQYECAWWCGDTRAKEWFTASDFLSVGDKAAAVKIGFIRPEE
jgi:hypothetical protein